MDDWREFLAGLSEAVLEDGASTEEIASVEQRLGTTLPPGYRTFLTTTNGFGPIGSFVRRLRPVGDIRWLRDDDPELVRIWTEATGDDALDKTLVVGDGDESERVLLNPAAADEGGEWEAWFFAHWVPGEERFASFRALLEELHSRFVDEQHAEHGEPTPRVSPELGVDADDVEGLVNALRNTRTSDRVAALDGLANLRDGAAAPAVVDLLQDDGEEGFVRETAARTLGQLRTEQSVAALVEVLRFPYPQGRVFDQRSPAQEAAIGLKHAARQGLLHLGKLARPALAAAIQDPDPNLRAEACVTLCHAHAWSKAIDLVSPLVADPDPDVRLTLVTHIDQLSHDRALLTTALGDSDPRVSSTARQTLDRLASYPT